MEANYVKDSYHSLSIEGYRVTEGLIEQVRSGKWEPKSSAQDADRKNVLAALEQASIQQDITAFAKFISSLSSR